MSSWSKEEEALPSSSVGGGGDAPFSPPAGPSSFKTSHPGRRSWMNEGDDGHQVVMTGYSNWATQPYSTSTTAASAAGHGAFSSYEQQMTTSASVSIAQSDPSSSAEAGVAMTTHQQPSSGPGDGVTSTAVFGFSPVETECRLCKRRIVTEISYVRGQAARFFCLFIAIMGILMPLICLFCLCLLPLCLKSCQDVLHSCPECKQPLQIVQKPLKNRRRQQCPKCC